MEEVDELGNLESGKAASARTAQRIRRDHSRDPCSWTQDDGTCRRLIGACSRSRTYAESGKGFLGCAHELRGGGDNGFHDAGSGQCKKAQQRGFRCFLADVELIFLMTIKTV